MSFGNDAEYRSGSGVLPGSVGSSLTGFTGFFVAMSMDKSLGLKLLKIQERHE